MRKALLLFLFLASVARSFAGIDPLEAVRKLRLRGDYAGAEKILSAAIRDSAGDSATHAILLAQLGDVLREEDRTTEARPMFERALQAEPASWQAHFSALAGLADLDRQASAWNNSLDEWRQSEKLAESHHAPVLAATAMRGLGETWMDKGNTARAEPLLRKAVSVLENDSAQYRLATALDTLASLYRIENKVAMAEELWVRELQIDREAMGANHPQTALVMGHLVEAWALDGDYERAPNYSRQVIDVMKNHFGRDSAPFASALVNDGMVEQHAHNYSVAAQQYSAALAILQSSSSEPGAEEQIVLRLFKTATVRAQRADSPKGIDGFMKNK